MSTLTIQQHLERKAKSAAIRSTEEHIEPLHSILGYKTFTFTNPATPRDPGGTIAVDWWKVKAVLIPALEEHYYEVHLRQMTDEFLSAVEAVKEFQQEV